MPERPNTLFAVFGVGQVDRLAGRVLSPPGVTDLLHLDGRARWNAVAQRLGVLALPRGNSGGIGDG